jgi:heterodisulfide reductase subunit B
MDLKPAQVVHNIRLGREDEVLNCKSIWLCQACETCTARCPQGLDLARIMDGLKMIAQRRGVQPKVPEIALFNEVFLRNINLLGRMYELGLIGELNLRTRQPFKDFAMGLEMLRKRKLKILPSYVRYPKRVKPLAPKPGQMAYYPGCSLHSSASEFDTSIRAVFKRLGIKLIEPKGWICCGSTPAHATSHTLATVLAIKNLALIEKSGHRRVMVPCAACFSRFKTAIHDVEEDPELKEQVAKEVDYDGSVEVNHFVETFIKDIGLEVVADAVAFPLTGLKTVCYYGCLLTRPPKVTGAENPEYPTTMDQLVKALGAETLDWSYKTECCGTNLSLTQTDIALDLSRKILQNALEVGAEAVVVACPLCHANLDMRQEQLALDSPLPIFYISQLIGLAFGLNHKELALGKHHVSPMGLLAKKSLLRD